MFTAIYIPTTNYFIFNQLWLMCLMCLFINPAETEEGSATYFITD